MTRIKNLLEAYIRSVNERENKSYWIPFYAVIDESWFPVVEVKMIFVKLSSNEDTKACLYFDEEKGEYIHVESPEVDILYEQSIKMLRSMLGLSMKSINAREGGIVLENEQKKIILYNMLDSNRKLMFFIKVKVRT